MLSVDPDVNKKHSVTKKQIQDTTNRLKWTMDWIPESFLYQERIDEIDYDMIIEKLQNISLFIWKKTEKQFFKLRFFHDLASVLVPELKKSFAALYSKQELYTDVVTLSMQAVFRPDYVSDNVNRHVSEYLKELFFDKIDGEALIKYISEHPEFVVKNVKLLAMEDELIAQFPPKPKD